MATNDYHFITHWWLDGTVEEAFDIIADSEGLTRWWPSVYLAADVARPGDESGVGKVVELHTKGWLPYTLRWRFEVTEVDRPRRLALNAHGDFDGRGVWTFVQEDDVVAIQYDWRIRADKPLLKYLSFLMRPLFAANHRWAMARGLESLKLEMARRRATSEADRQAVPRPPGPTGTAQAVALALGVGALAAGIAVSLALLIRKGTRPDDRSG